MHTRSTESAQQHDAVAMLNNSPSSPSSSPSGNVIQNSKFRASFHRMKSDMSTNSTSSSGSGDFISFTDITRTILAKEDEKTQTDHDACICQQQQQQQQGQDKEEEEDILMMSSSLTHGHSSNTFKI